MDKTELRKTLRAARRAHVAALPDATRALLFRRPPSPVMNLVPGNTTIGLYRAGPTEAPTGHYARFFSEEGHRIALPRFDHRGAAMQFTVHSDPFAESDLETGPFGLLQPRAGAEEVAPDILFVPLLAFTEVGGRIGQGGGHYDRWLDQHRNTVPIGLAWDVQKVDSLPLEDHDIAMRAVVTPTRLYGPF